MSKPEVNGTVKGSPEPLCAIYEPQCYARALELLGQGITCPRKVLLKSQTNLLHPYDMKSLVNANDPEAYREALGELGATTA